MSYSIQTTFRVIWKSIITSFENPELPGTLIASILAVVTVLTLYELIVYRFILRRSLYNKAFNICITVIPYFIAMIILCLQSNMVITLGTIGALAIIRFRNAVKDPVDLVFLLWSIFIGISCGCRIYSISIMTSVAVTVVLILLNYTGIRNKTHILVLHLYNDEAVAKAKECVKSNSRNYRIKSRNYSGDGVTVVIELFTRNAEQLASSLRSISEIEKISLMVYDYDDFI